LQINNGKRALVRRFTLTIVGVPDLCRYSGGLRERLRRRAALLWLVKSDVRKPLMYAAIVAIMLTFRLFARLMKSRRMTIVRMNS